MLNFMSGVSAPSFLFSSLQQQAAAPHAPASPPEVMSEIMPDLMSEVNVRPSQIGCLMSCREDVRTYARVNGT